MWEREGLGRRLGIDSRKVWGRHTILHKFTVYAKYSIRLCVGVWVGPLRTRTGGQGVPLGTQEPGGRQAGLGSSLV